MTSWTSSSARRALRLVLPLALCASCAAPRPKAYADAPTLAAGGRLAVLPPQNLTGGKVPLAPLQTAVREVLAERGFVLVEDATLEAFLARHRVRYTGGVDAAITTAAARELGVDALLVTGVESYAAEGVPAIAIGARLVGAGDPPAVLWTGMVSASGSDDPGLFERGLIGDAAVLQRRLLERLTYDLLRFMTAGGPRSSACRGGWRFRPQTFFLSAATPSAVERAAAVLPFVNETTRLKAGEAIALEMLRALHATDGYRVVEPGVVREELLRRRIIFEDGVSFDVARQLLDSLGADVVVGGRVFDHSDASSSAAVVSFSAYMLDRSTNPLIWATSSYHEGDDGVFFFDLGRVRTASGLACEMVSAAVDALARGTPTPGVRFAEDTTPAAFGGTGATKYEGRQ